MDICNSVIGPKLCYVTILGTFVYSGACKELHSSSSSLPPSALMYTVSIHKPDKATQTDKDHLCNMIPQY